MDQNASARSAVDLRGGSARGLRAGRLALDGLKSLVVFSLITALILVVGARLTAPADPPPRINVRWAPEVSSAERGSAERELRLLNGQSQDGRTWQYEVPVADPAVLEPIVRHPAIEDTHGIDRSTFQVVPDRASGDETWASLVEDVDRGFSRSSAHPGVQAAILVAIGLASFFIPVFQRLGHGVGRTIPAVSGSTLSLFRLCFGLLLSYAIWRTRFVPDVLPALDLHREAGWLADWRWIHELAARPRLLLALQRVAIVGALLFALGIFARAAYLIAVASLILLVLAKLQFSSSHDWGLPLVAILAMQAAPWRGGLKLGELWGARPPAAAGASNQKAGFGVWVPIFCLSLAFAGAAYAKLAVSGVSWVTTGAVKYHLLQDADAGYVLTPVQAAVVGNPSLAVGLSGAAIILEAAFVGAALVARTSGRLAYLLAGTMLLAGFRVLQGVFWPAWWILLAALFPWAAKERDQRSPDTAETGISRLQAAIISSLLFVQVTASAAGVEVEPLISNYPMYSTTYQSPEAFNAAYRLNSRRYLVFVAPDRGCAQDVTAKVLDTPNALQALTHLVEGGAASDADRAAARALESLVRALPAGADQSAALAQSQILVAAGEREFDWTRRRFTPEQPHVLGVLEGDGFKPVVVSLVQCHA